MIKVELGFKISPFFTISYLKVFYILCPLVVAFLFYHPEQFSIIGHVAGLLLSEIYLLVIVWTVGFEKRERQMVIELVKSVTLRIHKKK